MAKNVAAKFPPDLELQFTVYSPLTFANCYYLNFPAYWWLRFSFTETAVPNSLYGLEPDFQPLTPPNLGPKIS